MLMCFVYFTITCITKRLWYWNPHCCFSTCTLLLCLQSSHYWFLSSAESCYSVYSSCYYLSSRFGEQQSIDKTDLLMFKMPHTKMCNIRNERVVSSTFRTQSHTAEMQNENKPARSDQVKYNQTIMFGMWWQRVLWNNKAVTTWLLLCNK